MATFPAPPLTPHPFQELPEPGTPMTEAALLQLLLGHLRPLEALVLTLYHALEHSDLTFKVTGPLLDLAWLDLNNLGDLVEAWWHHQPLPVARRGGPPEDLDA